MTYIKYPQVEDRSTISYNSFSKIHYLETYLNFIYTISTFPC